MDHGVSERLCVAMPVRAAARRFVQKICFALRTAGVRDWLRYVLWGGAWLMAAASVVAGFVNGLRELDFQWDPAKLLMLGDNPYAYTLEHKVVPYEGFVEKYTVANQMPSCLLLLAPWTVMPQVLANYVWDVCNLVFTAVFLLYLYRLFFRDTGWADRFYLVPLVLLAGMPWRMLIGNGQHLMFSLACLRLVRRVGFAAVACCQVADDPEHRLDILHRQGLHRAPYSSQHSACLFPSATGASCCLAGTSANARGKTLRAYFSQAF